MIHATNPYAALMDITARPQTVFVRGEGAYLWDDGGKRYLDFMQGWAVNCLGHSPAVVADALAAQAKLLLTPSPAFYNGPSLKLANALVENSCFDQVFFANSGAEANEGAIKLARRYGTLHKAGAFEIITFEGGFHGRTLATMSASGKKAFEPLFEPKVSGFRKAKLNDLDSVKQLISDNTVAVMLEPIQGEAGVWPATDQFLQALRALTKEHGLLLIVDEIQTGMGRTGKLFHYEHAGRERLCDDSHADRHLEVEREQQAAAPDIAEPMPRRQPLQFTLEDQAGIDHRLQEIGLADLIEHDKSSGAHQGIAIERAALVAVIEA